MRVTDIFLRRPVLAIVVNLVIIIAGLQAVRTLNVRQYPKLESATVTVRTAYVGASADLVRGFITTPLEHAIAAADGIDFIESQSVQGLSTINVRLKLNFNASGALADITARVNQVRADLPPEASIVPVPLTVSATIRTEPPAPPASSEFSALSWPRARIEPFSTSSPTSRCITPPPRPPLAPPEVSSAPPPPESCGR